jgi:hypothetical protein
MLEERPIPRLTIARWLAGPAIWAAHFLVVYASESLLCTRGGGASAHLAIIGVATAVGLALLLATTLRGRGPSTDTDGAGFMNAAATSLALLGMLGIAWSALPALLVSSCTLPA